jgi:molybdenum-dependent DNA-binding transcriptional regulator ModE
MVKKNESSNLRKSGKGFAEIVDRQKMELFLFLARGGSLKAGAKLIGMSYKHVRDMALEWQAQKLIYRRVWGEYLATASGELMVQQLEAVRDRFVEVGIWQRK